MFCLVPQPGRKRLLEAKHVLKMRFVGSNPTLSFLGRLPLIRYLMMALLYLWS